MAAGTCARFGLVRYSYMNFCTSVTDMNSPGRAMPGGGIAAADAVSAGASISAAITRSVTRYIVSLRPSQRPLSGLPARVDGR